MPPKVSRILTKTLLMAGTVFLTLLPLYLTSWKDAVYDGNLLVIAFVFSGDAVLRCLDPSNKKNGNLKLLFALGSIAMFATAALQYGPIANDLRKEKDAIQQSKKDNSEPLIKIEEERQDDEAALPNNSAALLIASVLVGLSVIILL